MMKHLALIILIVLSALSAQVTAQQPFEKCLSCLERAGLDEWPLQPSYQQNASHAARIASTPFTPDSITFAYSPQFGAPFNTSSSKKITYGPQNRPQTIKSYSHNATGIEVYWTDYIEHTATGKIARYLSVPAAPNQGPYAFEQNFSPSQLLTSQKTFFTVNNQLELLTADSLEYILQNGQVSTLIYRLYSYQQQQWNLVNRYSNIQLDPSGQMATAFRKESWDSTGLSWQSPEEYKNLSWDLYYEGIHQIAGFYIHTFNERPYNFPGYRAVILPNPSSMVYGVTNGTAFDTLWHYYATYNAGALIQVDRDQFVNGIRQPFRRILYGYDGFGLPSTETLENWSGSSWVPYKKIENVRNQQLNFIMHADSAWYGGTDSWVNLEVSTFQYDSLATGEISEFKSIEDLSVGNPPSLFRASFWYDGISAGEEPQKTVSIRLFPNPVKDGLMVAGLEGPGHLKCYDLTGKLVFEADVANESQWIDWRSVPAGLYLVNVSNARISKNIRLIKID
jgi:hypothetical protein